MAKFFGALFIFAAIVFLYKAGVLIPDIARAFGEFRGSYDPAYVPPSSLDERYNAYSYEAGRGAYYSRSAPSYSYPSYPTYPSYANYPNVYARGGAPAICYDNYLPVIDGVNYNPPRWCNQYVEDTRFGYPQLPTYRSSAYYPALYAEDPVYEYNPYPVRPSAYQSAPPQTYYYPPSATNTCK